MYVSFDIYLEVMQMERFEKFIIEHFTAIIFIFAAMWIVLVAYGLIAS